MKKSGLWTHLGTEAGKKNTNMLITDRTGPMEAPSHQQVLTICTAEIHIHAKSSLASSTTLLPGLSLTSRDVCLMHRTQYGYARPPCLSTQTRD